jgi:hypothetical protein
VNLVPADLTAALDRTEARLLRDGYRGYDPYDALTSPLFRLPLLRSAHLPRWGFQQVLKRLPLQTRPLLGIRPGYNPVTLGLAVQAWTERDRAAGADRRRAEVERLVAELQRLRSPGWSGSCWGYDFDWEARYASFPAGLPTVVATGFVTHALFQAHAHYGLPAARDLVVDAAAFVLQDLNRTDVEDGFCFSYSPRDHNTVINATVKGARLLVQAAHLAGGNAGWVDTARTTLRYVAAHQQPDGKWPYALGDARSWADHFHTCYNLDGLAAFQELAADDTFAGVIERGTDYYRRHFFRADGAPRYYDNEAYPLDATCCGQALLTLVRLGDLDQAGRTAAWILDRMALPDGAWKYQITPHRENRLVYVRWSVAWIAAGLAALERALA